jgi:hypothetical protein
LSVNKESAFLTALASNMLPTDYVLETAGVNFTNILRAAFTCTEKRKKYSQAVSFFVFLGSACIKTAQSFFIKWTFLIINGFWLITLFYTHQLTIFRIFVYLKLLDEIIFCAQKIIKGLSAEKHRFNSPIQSFCFAASPACIYLHEKSTVTSRQCFGIQRNSYLS